MFKYSYISILVMDVFVSKIWIEILLNLEKQAARGDL